MSLPAPLRDLVLLLTRIGVGGVFMAHGWQKLNTNGVTATAGFFDSVGVPLPTLSAWAATLLELVGGAALVVGAAVPVVGVLLALDMIGAYVFVHAGKGVFVTEGGWELVLTLGLVSLLLAALGAGKYSVDHALLGRRTTRERASA